MSTMTIRKIDDHLKARLRIRAAENGHSIEAEVKDILKAALNGDRDEVPPIPEKGLGTWMRDHFAEIGGVALDIPKRTELARYASE